MAEPTDNLPLPKRTTPTWEIELLLSGATVFALVQLAGALPAWGNYLLPRLADPWLELGRLMLLYGNSAVVLLCLAFLLHLGLRGYWVALVGMDSVFPGGLNTDRLQAGPIARSLLEKRWTNMDDAIERADNRATVVFGLGLGLALVLATVTVAALLLFLVSLAIASLLGDSRLATGILLALMALWIGPQLAAGYADRLFGHRLRPGGLPWRILRGTLSAYSWAGMSRESSPLVTIYSSNVGEKRSTWVVAVVMVCVTVLSIALAAAYDDDLGPGSYGLFPEGQRDATRAVRHHHYASRHEPGQTPGLPFIPDLVARDRYLPLVVPYVPTAHAHLLERCDRGPVPRDGAGRDARHLATLGCLEAGFTLTLDGEPLALAPEAFSDAGRDLRGLLYMVPLGGLAPGRHELQITLTPAEPPKDGAGPPAWRIPFWR
ncbi:hypothetical protein [Arenimonas caeni]|uniref:Uncharacterized protein n=1 Tax=Arenimonas caeni TaxID=2058085 RepID=A0A2P6M600_9GAMM|nr:hypothetical protein [Arenimonas caeni]PRH81335.1 hypothetical protein C6N40_13150 [Arenimonas caeni]